MDPRLLRYYNQELQHLREVGAEFSKQFPKIAARLGMEGIEVTDPYVERLLEGVAFMAARVQLKIDAEFPRFTQRLLEIVYPNYLAPMPAMLVARIEPQLDDANLAKGFVVPRGSSLQAQTGRGDKTACEFRTAHDVTLWPLEITGAEYFSFAPDLPLGALGAGQRVKGGVRLRLRSTGGLPFNKLELDRLRVFISGADEAAYKLYELCHGACIGGIVRPLPQPAPWHELLSAECVKPAGFADEEALLPVTLRSFQGYRLLQEYFAFPQRFCFFDIEELGSAVRRHAGNELEIALLFERGDPSLESVVDAANFQLFCAPAINLFPKRADRIHLSDSVSMHHVVPDRTRPMDFEVYEVTGVTGYGIGVDSEQTFHPFYSAFHTEDVRRPAYYVSHREPRLLSEHQKQTGLRTSYVGTEVFLSLVDSREAPYKTDLRQLAVTALCTNRDLPLQMPLHVGKTDFTLGSAAPVAAIRCVKGPSKPLAPLGEGALAWRFISHLSLNYLSLLDSSESDGAAALREILSLYAASADTAMKRQIDGVRSVRTKRSVRRLPYVGRIAYGRGIEVELEVDELAFQGGSAFLFGSVMEQFFSRHVAINSFTETALRSLARGPIMRWVPRCGQRPIL
ncbi:MAG TPA: type VI secretion system baseplate subunit TssF [Burkholderiales bacterium]|nr:type VI secretion system baseplate subunit TssF [Burkholderiales bacterium]